MGNTFSIAKRGRNRRPAPNMRIQAFYERKMEELAGGEMESSPRSAADPSLMGPLEGGPFGEHTGRMKRSHKIMMDGFKHGWVQVNGLLNDAILQMIEAKSIIVEVVELMQNSAPFRFIKPMETAPPHTPRRALLTILQVAFEEITLLLDHHAAFVSKYSDNAIFRVVPPSLWASLSGIHDWLLRQLTEFNLDPASSKSASVGQLHLPEDQQTKIVNFAMGALELEIPLEADLQTREMRHWHYSHRSMLKLSMPYFVEYAEESEDPDQFRPAIQLRQHCKDVYRCLLSASRLIDKAQLLAWSTIKFLRADMDSVANYATEMKDAETEERFSHVLRSIRAAQSRLQLCESFIGNWPATQDLKSILSHWDLLHAPTTSSEPSQDDSPHARLRNVQSGLALLTTDLHKLTACEHLYRDSLFFMDQQESYDEMITLLKDMGLEEMADSIPGPGPTSSSLLYAHILGSLYNIVQNAPSMLQPIVHLLEEEETLSPSYFVSQLSHSNMDIDSICTFLDNMCRKFHVEFLEVRYILELGMEAGMDQWDAKRHEEERSQRAHLAQLRTQNVITKSQEISLLEGSEDNGAAEPSTSPESPPQPIQPKPLLASTAPNDDRIEKMYAIQQMLAKPPQRPTTTAQPVVPKSAPPRVSSKLTSTSSSSSSPMSKKDQKKLEKRKKKEEKERKKEEKKARKAELKRKGKPPTSLDQLTATSAPSTSPKSVSAELVEEPTQVSSHEPSTEPIEKLEYLSPPSIASLKQNMEEIGQQAATQPKSAPSDVTGSEALLLAPAADYPLEGDEDEIILNILYLERAKMLKESRTASTGDVAIPSEESNSERYLSESTSGEFRNVRTVKELKKRWNLELQTESDVEILLDALRVYDVLDPREAAIFVDRVKAVQFQHGVVPNSSNLTGVKVFKHAQNRRVRLQRERQESGRNGPLTPRLTSSNQDKPLFSVPLEHSKKQRHEVRNRSAKYPSQITSRPLSLASDPGRSYSSILPPISESALKPKRYSPRPRRRAKATAPVQPITAVSSEGSMEVVGESDVMESEEYTPIGSEERPLKPVFIPPVSPSAIRPAKPLAAVRQSSKRKQWKPLEYIQGIITAPFKGFGRLSKEALSSSAPASPSSSLTSSWTEPTAHNLVTPPVAKKAVQFPASVPTNRVQIAPLTQQKEPTASPRKMVQRTPNLSQGETQRSSRATSLSSSAPASSDTQVSHQFTSSVPTEHAHRTPLRPKRADTSSQKSKSLPKVSKSEIESFEQVNVRTKNPLPYSKTSVLSSEFSGTDDEYEETEEGGEFAPLYTEFPLQEPSLPPSDSIATQKATPSFRATTPISSPTIPSIERPSLATRAASFEADPFASKPLPLRNVLTRNPYVPPKLSGTPPSPSVPTYSSAGSPLHVRVVSPSPSQSFSTATTFLSPSKIEPSINESEVHEPAPVVSQLNQEGADESDDSTENSHTSTTIQGVGHVHASREFQESSPASESSPPSTTPHKLTKGRKRET